MAEIIAYLPVVFLLLIAVAMLLVTASDRRLQVAMLGGSVGSFFRGNKTARRRAKLSIMPQRIVFWCIVLFLLSYIATYQKIQNVIAEELTANQIEKVTVGSLIIPYTAFFRTAYTADAGFSRSKKRVRTAIKIRGHLLSGFVIEMDEASVASINKVTGKAFVFSYLSDVEILRPAINNYMKKLLQDKEIDKYEIETFDNRGPYLIVALNEKNRSKDAATVAKNLAEGLHKNLTQANQLKVNQVIVKVVEAEGYVSDGTINVVARGKAGSY